eukprot:4231633-Karenia_brevis.AAC.1
MGLAGIEKDRAMVRSSGPKFVMRPALRKGSRAPRVSKVTAAWCTAAAWLRDVQHGLGSTNAALIAKGRRAMWRLANHAWGFQDKCDHGRVFLEWRQA